MTIVCHPRVFLEEWPALARLVQKSLMALQFDRRSRYNTETGKTRSGPGNDGVMEQWKTGLYWASSTDYGSFQSPYSSFPRDHYSTAPLLHQCSYHL